VLQNAIERTVVYCSNSVKNFRNISTADNYNISVTVDVVSQTLIQILAGGARLATRELALGEGGTDHAEWKYKELNYFRLKPS
jgi:hypothetical protein